MAPQIDSPLPRLSADGISLLLSPGDPATRLSSGDLNALAAGTRYAHRLASLVSATGDPRVTKESLQISLLITRNCHTVFAALEDKPEPRQHEAIQIYRENLGLLFELTEALLQ